MRGAVQKIYKDGPLITFDGPDSGPRSALLVPLVYTVPDFDAWKYEILFVSDGACIHSIDISQLDQSVDHLFEYYSIDIIYYRNHLAEYHHNLHSCSSDLLFGTGCSTVWSSEQLELPIWSDCSGHVLNGIHVPRWKFLGCSGMYRFWIPGFGVECHLDELPR